MQSIRKNNDIEGWHYGLNKTAADRCGLPLHGPATQGSSPGIIADSSSLREQA